jgi:sphingomyelin phosphodiesterase acid-like 3
VEQTMRKVYQLFFLFLMILCCQDVLADETPTAEKFISIADIHFDPFIDCEKKSGHCEILKKLRAAHHDNWESIFEKYSEHHVSQTGQDTNYFLLKSTLEALKKLAKKDHPQFVTVLGDFLAHDYHDKYVKYSGDNTRAGYQKFVKRTLEFLTLEINKVFPTTDVYPVIGNNDSYTGDYSVIPQGAFFKDTVGTWAELIKNKANQEAFRRDFPLAGYYAVSVPNHQNEKLIMLDSVMFSTNAQGRNLKQASQQQFKWLQDQLDDAKKHHQKVMIGFHIPVGINVYATIKDQFGMIWKFWARSYRKEFDRMLRQNPDLVTSVLAAHIHRDIFQFIRLGSFTRIPVIITPSISPLFGNNPGFKEFTYQPSGFYISDVDAYTFDLSNAQPHDWKISYNSKDPQLEETIISKIET